MFTLLPNLIITYAPAGIGIGISMAQAGQADEGSHPLLAFGTPIGVYDVRYTDGYEEVGGAMSDIYDLSGNDNHLTQASGSARPTVATSGDGTVATFTVAQTMAAASVAGFGAVAGFTLFALGQITASGVNATTDAVLDITDGSGNTVRLEAGHASQFHGDWNNAGTNWQDLTPDSTDLAGDGFHLFCFEFANASDVISNALDNQVRGTAGSNSGTMDNSGVTITLGSSLAFDFVSMGLFADIFTEAQRTSIAAIMAANESSVSLVSGKAGTRNTAVPVLDNTSPSITDTLAIDSGNTWVNWRNASNVLTYQWENNPDGDLGTSATQALSASDEDDTIRIEVTNTPSGATAVAAYSAYTSAVSAGGGSAGEATGMLQPFTLAA